MYPCTLTSVLQTSAPSLSDDRQCILCGDLREGGREGLKRETEEETCKGTRVECGLKATLPCTRDRPSAFRGRVSQEKRQPMTDSPFLCCSSKGCKHCLAHKSHTAPCRYIHLRGGGGRGHRRTQEGHNDIIDCYAAVYRGGRHW